ncbi:hypothetical protein FHR22_001578 [Sphingopyxis panaciterrae]|uniref:hypothetical protein n=1 Tax=Sphingopyxis panaciterrae TaxID=363841 RepID=UPI001FB9B2EE|nr:hypothetical protein [Sphingopyxis panaciterrae]NIJ36894.1 hypothetical protein [Sphingopyxis panaciterrae]
MRDAPNPRAERTAPVKLRKALPERNLNVLIEVAAQVAIGLISSRNASKTTAEARHRIRKNLILFGFGHPKSPATIVVWLFSRQRRDFLTGPV